MQSFVESLLYVVFVVLGILFYMNVLYKHIVRTTDNPVYAKKAVWNILFRLILLLLGIVLLACYRHLHTVPQWFLYICIAVFTILFIWTLQKIRSYLQE
jgi:hypothetical protein